ncbi:MAG: DUF6122 family protein [Pseudomonadales bacterium]
MFHILLHFLIPALIAYVFFKRQWKIAYLIMVATMLVDLDHLLAIPIYDPGRCSMGFHPLHSYALIVLYALICFIPKLRFIGIGLVIHMLLDSIDCQLTNGSWFV